MRQACLPKLTKNDGIEFAFDLLGEHLGSVEIEKKRNDSSS
jgi:hypothetical protein